MTTSLSFGSNYGIYLYRGSDPPRPDFDGRNKRNRFLNNVVHGNRGRGIFLKESDDNVFQGNLFTQNYGLLWFVNGQRNRLQGNLIPDEETVRAEGSPNFAGSITIADQPTVHLQLDVYSSAYFEDLQGHVFDPEEDGLATTLSPTKSSLTLNSAQISKTSTVVTRNFQAVPDAGVALLGINIWNMSGDLSKGWVVQAGSSTHSISYTVGDLAPSTSYTLLRNGVSSSVKSNSAGVVSYKDSAVQPGMIEYYIRP